MIRSSKHSLKFANKRKLEDLSWFIDEYRRCASIIMDYLWTHEYVWTVEDRSCVMDIKNNKLDCPLFVSVDIINQCNLNTILTSRILKSCSTQVCGMISAEITKQKKRLYTLHKLKEEGIHLRAISHYYLKNTPHTSHTFIMNYSSIDLDKLPQAIEILEKILYLHIS